MPTYEVQSYHASLGKLKILADNTVVEVVATIRCSTGGRGPLLDIAFIPDGNPLPANVSQPFNTSFRPLSEYVYYLDMLRNEKPVSIRSEPNDLSRHGLEVGSEPVGEGEPPT